MEMLSIYVMLIFGASQSFHPQDAHFIGKWEATVSTPIYENPPRLIPIDPRRREQLHLKVIGARKSRMTLVLASDHNFVWHPFQGTGRWRADGKGVVITWSNDREVDFILKTFNSYEVQRPGRPWKLSLKYDPAKNVLRWHAGQKRYQQSFWVILRKA